MKIIVHKQFHPTSLFLALEKWESAVHLVCKGRLIPKGTRFSLMNKTFTVCSHHSFEIKKNELICKDYAFTVLQEWCFPLHAPHPHASDTKPFPFCHQSWLHHRADMMVKTFDGKYVQCCTYVPAAPSSGRSWGVFLSHFKKKSGTLSLTCKIKFKSGKYMRTRKLLIWFDVW